MCECVHAQQERLACVLTPRPACQHPKQRGLNAAALGGVPLSRLYLDLAGRGRSNPTSPLTQAHCFSSKAGLRKNTEKENRILGWLREIKFLLLSTL